MNSRTIVFFIAVALMLVMSSSLTFAQHDHNNSQASSDVMQECQKHQSEVAALVDQMSTTLAEAREQSDLDKVRAAIDKVQSQLGEIQHHMSMCPVARSGASDESDRRMTHMKCMSDKQKSEEKNDIAK